jgi:hypothetical protein
MSKETLAAINAAVANAVAAAVAPPTTTAPATNAAPSAKAAKTTKATKPGAAPAAGSPAAGSRGTLVVAEDCKSFEINALMPTDWKASSTGKSSVAHVHIPSVKVGNGTIGVSMTLWFKQA